MRWSMTCAVSGLWLALSSCIDVANFIVGETGAEGQECLISMAKVGLPFRWTLWHEGAVKCPVVPKDYIATEKVTVKVDGSKVTKENKEEELK